MTTQKELEELIREHGLAPYVYIKNEEEQFKIKLMSHANYITWRQNPRSNRKENRLWEISISGIVTKIMRATN